MFFKTKRNPRKTTRQTLSTEQLEPKAMFSVSPVEPVVALDVGPVNQAGYDCQGEGHFQLTHRIGTTAGPGGTSFMTGEDGRMIVHPQYNVGSSASPGGDNIFMPMPEPDISIVSGGNGNGYAEAVGLDSSTLDTSSNVQLPAENVSLYDHVQTPRSQAFARMGR